VKDIRETIVQLVKENSKIVDVLRRLLRLEEALEARYGSMYSEMGFTASEAFNVGVNPSTVVVLARVYKMLDVVDRPDGSVGYKFKNRAAVYQALRHALHRPGGAEEEVKVDESLFDDIEGHEAKKRILLMAIKSPRPVHVLLIGTPGTAKSLFLQALSRLPNSVYLLGSRTSKAGLAKFIYEHRPKYIIIDEIDKMRWEDQTVLLSLMETGIITVMLKNERFSIRVNTWVFAGANYEHRIDPALLDRFIVLRFREYRPDEFVRIMPKVLIKREGVDPELAKYIVERLVKYSRSARDAIKIARIAKTKEDVDFIIEQMFGKNSLI